MIRKHNKKGQAAMEFLMTYGWALLVVIVAIAALIFFGILNPGQFLPDRCQLSPGIACLDYITSQRTPAGELNLTFIIQNGMGEDLSQLEIRIDECYDAVVGYQSFALIPSGDEFRVNRTGCGANYSVGSSFSSDLTIMYNSSNGIKHIRTGSIRTTVQQE